MGTEYKILFLRNSSSDITDVKSVLIDNDIAVEYAELCDFDHMEKVYADFTPHLILSELEENHTETALNKVREQDTDIPFILIGSGEEKEKDIQDLLSKDITDIVSLNDPARLSSALKREQKLHFLEHSLAEKEKKHRNTEQLLATLIDITSSLSEAEELKEISRLVCKELIRHFDLEDCVIYSLNPDGKSLTQVAATGPKETEAHHVANPITLEVGQGIVGSVAKERKPILIGDTSLDSRYVVDDDLRYSELAVPIKMNNKVIGVIDSEHSKKNFYTNEHLNNLTAVAAVIASKFKAAQEKAAKEIAKKRLEETELKLKTVTDNIPGLILKFYMKPDGSTGFLYLSDGVKEIYEVEPEQAVESQQLLDDMIEVDQQEAFHRSITDSAENLTPWNMTWKIRTPGGKEKWLQGKGSPIAEEDGTIIWNILIIDVTREKEYEQRLSENEHRIEAAMRGADISIWESDYRTGKNSISDRWLSMLGYEIDPELNTYEFFTSCIHPEDRELAKAEVKRIEEGGKNQFEVIIRLKARCGEYRYILDRGSVVEFNENGKALRSIGTHLDITENIKLQKELEEKEFRLEAAMKGAKIGVYDLNLKTGKAILNKEWSEMTGYEFENNEADLDFFVSIVHPDEKELPQKLIDEVKERGESDRRIVRTVRHQDGHYMKLLSKARIVEYDEDGEPSRMIGSHLDITETINLQEELQKSLDEKVILLTEIHHRVKNNLAIIGGLFELQALNSEDEKVNDVLKGMGNRVKSIADVHELLYNSDSFAQISMEDYLKKLIRNISKTYCDCQKVRVDLNINSQLKLNINQAIPLGLMLNELITNSYKYAFEDVEAPLISFSLTHKDDKYIATYSDNGPGFSVNEFKQAKSLGFTLINALLEQLSAEYTTPGNHSYPLNFSFSHQLKGSHSALK